MEACVRDEELLWARGTRGAAEARALGWLHNNNNDSDNGNANDEVAFEPFSTHARHLDDHLTTLFECTFNQARKHVVRRFFSEFNELLLFIVHICVCDSLDLTCFHLFAILLVISVLHCVPREVFLLIKMSL